jgi:hypothetical protein
LIDEVLLGIFGDVHNGTFDLGVSPVSITAKRFRNFSFVDSFLRRTYVAVIHQDNLITANPSEFIFHLLQVLLPNEMWMSICGVFCVVILFGTFSEFLGNPDNEATCGKFAWLQVCIKRLFRTLGTGLGIHGIGTLTMIKLIRFYLKFGEFLFQRTSKGPSKYNPGGFRKLFFHQFG